MKNKGIIISCKEPVKKPKAPINTRLSRLYAENLLCSFSSHTLFTDPGTFTTTLALVKQFCTADMAGFVQFNRINIGRIKRKDPFNAYTIRDLANSKSGSMASPLFFKYITFKRLD